MSDEHGSKMPAGYYGVNGTFITINRGAVPEQEIASGQRKAAEEAARRDNIGSLETARRDGQVQDRREKLAAARQTEQSRKNENGQE